MLRRSVAALLIAVAVCATAGCGIKGPLRLPPAKPGAPEATSMPQPSPPSSETISPTVPDAVPQGRTE